MFNRLKGLGIAAVATMLIAAPASAATVIDFSTGLAGEGGTITWDGTNRKLPVPTLQGSYARKLANGAIAGEWTQPGGKLPLQLAPFQKTVLSSDAMKPYVGEWTSTLSLGGQSQKLMFTFNKTIERARIAELESDRFSTRKASFLDDKPGEFERRKC